MKASSKLMTPDDEIGDFLGRLRSVMEKYEVVASDEVDRLLEGNMKVIDHKVPAIGDMIAARDDAAARLTLHHAVEAVARLEAALDGLIAGR